MNQVNRRNFLRLAGAGAAAAAAAPVAQAMGTITASAHASQPGQSQTPTLQTLSKVPRNEHSMPGLFPGRVARCEE
ncbi:MAG: twin-arginine translocation signal domain-containing protein [Bacteroidales bacterium]|nr:twin-arginine translocation signal domain-containing protein [Bacteroidales bacterium]